eukprot:2469267-Pyramimonas_sp.AAC.1
MTSTPTTTTDITTRVLLLLLLRSAGPCMTAQRHTKLTLTSSWEARVIWPSAEDSGDQKGAGSIEVGLED